MEDTQAMQGDAPRLEVVDEGGEVAEVIEMAEGPPSGPPKLEPLRKFEDGTYNREIPHISELRRRKEELREEKRAKAKRRETPAETIDEQMERASEDMEDAFMSHPPLSRPQRRAARNEAKLKGVGYTRKGRKR